MSHIVWQKILIPDPAIPASVLIDESYKDQVENVRPYPKAAGEIEIPDPKALRSMSRASVFLSHLCMQAKEALAPHLAKSPFSVGIYCAVENGPIDAPSTAKILAQGKPEQFADFYRKFRNPKMYLKQLPNLAPAQMGISMGLQGPMNVYTHSEMASIHALDQAEWDLFDGIVDAALVCTAHAFDDFMVVKRSRNNSQLCLNEGGAVLLLEKSTSFNKWTEMIPSSNKDSYGISNQIIQYLKGNNHV